jgi:hypothetical protein
MSGQRISVAVRRRVAEAARFRCGYCQTAQAVIGPLLEIDHIIPEALGGTNHESNLFLSCPMCNSHKRDQVEAIDLQTGNRVPLFNPRLDEWSVHFEWQGDGVVVAGRTGTGRATVTLLNMNHPDIVAARRLWVLVGWHPPKG